MEPLDTYLKPETVYTFPSRTEMYYPETAARLTNVGGVYLGVIGGMESVFAQLVKSRPEKVVLFDINPYAVSLAKLRFQLLRECPDFESYNKRYDDILKGREPIPDGEFNKNEIRAIIEAKRPYNIIFHNSIRDKEDCGWGKPEEYAELRRIAKEVPIEVINENGLNIGRLVHEATNGSTLPISVLYISDFLNVIHNWKIKLPEFIETLEALLAEGKLSPECEVVDISFDQSVDYVTRFKDYIAKQKEFIAKNI